MVLNNIKKFFEGQKKKFDNEKSDEAQLESFRETEELKKAEESKHEADRLAQLKQYTPAIEEYQKALELYPFKGDEENMFKNAADFLFKCHYNIAASYSYLDKFEKAVESFEKALNIKMIEDANKVRALMGKGNIYYRKRLVVEGRYRSGAYMSAEEDMESDKLMDKYKDEDKKKNFIKLAHDCFAEAANLDKFNLDAWYYKGYMEMLLSKVKDAVQSFDSVLNMNKNYENKESVQLFDEIKKEKGISIKTSELLDRGESVQPTFRTKTGHLVRSRAEMMIANFLFDNDLLFQYNSVATWADKDDFRASFYIPKLDLYIDHHAYDYAKEYQKIMKSKIKQYEKHKKKSVYTTSEDETNIEDALKLKLKPYIIL